ncbi:MAG: hypothetical protein IJ225_10440 [Solobacterium sp.]|nr:hypothetical protein [Solobacterium sp.]
MTDHNIYDTFEERQCKLCGKSILFIHMKDGTDFPVDYHPVDVEFPNKRNADKPRQFYVVNRELLEAVKGDTKNFTLQAYIPHQLTCVEYLKRIR